MSNTMLFVLILLASSPVGLRAQQTVERPDRLGAVVHNYSVAETDFTSALRSIASEHKIPLLIEQGARLVPLKRGALSWQKATVRQVIESVVKSQPGYDVAVEDGMVNVFMRDFRNDRHNFLNIKLANFEARNESTAVVAQKLSMSARYFLSPPPPGPEVAVLSVAIGAGEGLVTFKAGLTVREIMARLALSSDFKIWIITFSDPPSITPTGFRRVAGAAARDYAQPWWEQLRWGEKPYW